MLRTRNVTIMNPTGLHLRAASNFVHAANAFRADIYVRNGGKEANGKSILDMLTLEAYNGDTLSIAAKGQDAGEALDSLENLVKRKFDLEDPDGND